MVVGQPLGWLHAHLLVPPYSSEQLDVRSAASDEHVNITDIQQCFQKYQQVMTPVNATTTDLNHLAVVLAPKNPVKSRSSMCGGGFQCFLWYSFKVIASSSTVLPLNMCCLLSMKREDNMCAQSRLSRGGKRPVSSRMCSQKWIF